MFYQKALKVDFQSSSSQRYYPRIAMYDVTMLRVSTSIEDAAQLVGFARGMARKLRNADSSARATIQEKTGNARYKKHGPLDINRSMFLDHVPDEFKEDHYRKAYFYNNINSLKYS